jgi:F-type H+-transporting ATPase subunit epsilon
MNLTVLTPEKEFFNGEIRGLIVPGSKGEFKILDNHAPIISSLSSGKVQIIETSGELKVFSIAAGFIEVLNNEVALLVNGLKDE